MGRQIKFSGVAIGYNKSQTRDELWSKFTLLIKRFSVHNSQSPAVIHCVNLRCQHQYNLFFSLQLCSVVESKHVCVCLCVCGRGGWYFAPTAQHCLDHWPPWVADQPLYQLYQVLRRSHRGVLSEGFVFFFHFMLWWPRLCWPESVRVCVCTLGLTRGQCRIRGRISGTELDSRTWRFPLEERQKKRLSPSAEEMFI